MKSEFVRTSPSLNINFSQHETSYLKKRPRHPLYVFYCLTLGIALCYLPNSLLALAQATKGCHGDRKSEIIGIFFFCTLSLH